MLLLYRLLFPVALFAAMPFFLPRMVRRGGYARHFGQRLGRVPTLPSKHSGSRRIWIHAVSVGELQALRPLLDLLCREHPSIQVVMTTTTSTGYALAEQQYARSLTHLGYFPLDFWPISRRVWESLQPDLSVLMEGEIWPEHLHQAKIRHIPTVLINARLSERSFHRWRFLPGWLRFPLTMMSMVVAASEEDAQRFRQLGLPKERVVVSGNLKLDFTPSPILDPAQVSQLRRELGLIPDQDVACPAAEQAAGDTLLVLAGASTWPGEEEMLARVAQRLVDQGIDCKLLLVPRHVERRAALRDLLAGARRRMHFRSSGPADGPVDVVVADTTGEMALLLQAADVVFVGKSMDPHKGGQNPIEAAALGKAVLFGPNMQNFRGVVSSMLAAGAGKTVQDETQLLKTAAQLLGSRSRREVMGRAALQWHQAGKGSSRRTMAVISRFLETAP